MLRCTSFSVVYTGMHALIYILYHFHQSQLCTSVYAWEHFAWCLIWSTSLTVTMCFWWKRCCQYNFMFFICSILTFTSKMCVASFLLHLSSFEFDCKGDCHWVYLPDTDLSWVSVAKCAVWPDFCFMMKQLPLPIMQSCKCCLCQ